MSRKFRRLTGIRSDTFRSLTDRLYLSEMGELPSLRLRLEPAPQQRALRGRAFRRGVGVESRRFGGPARVDEQDVRLRGRELKHRRGQVVPADATAVD